MGAGKFLPAASLSILMILNGVSGTPAQAAAPPARALSAPAAPNITEPLADGQLVSAADVHMETGPFRDSDAGDQHQCSDWEIWTVSPSQRVWFINCIGGAQKVHCHLGDGIFENSHANRTDLLPNRDYLVRVRHRDNSGGAAGGWGPYAERRFRTDSERKPLPGASQWRVTQPGYVVEEVASGLQLPVNIAMAPGHGDPSKPMFYVTELYGRIKVVKGDFQVSTYASNLLNFNPNGQFPGSGEIGLTGIVVEPTTGDVFAAMLYKSGDRHYPKVVRFHSTDGGLTASSRTTILDMSGAPQEASHQISNLSIGPDKKLYVHMGDGFTPSIAQNLDSFRGKVLRLNLDGSAPADNPFYDAGDGIKARDYVFASGFRNPFGGAWRAADGQHYEVENGPSIDRLARVTKGTNYGWDGGNGSIRQRALYTWDPSHAPVNIAFIEAETHHAAGFPPDKYGHAYVSESGPTYATGPQSRGKRIVEFTFGANGSVSAPRSLVEYNGSGKTSVAGLAAGPDGLYFSGLYSDSTGDNPTSSNAKIYRVRYAPQATDVAPLVAYQSAGFTGRSQVFGTGVFEGPKGEMAAVGEDMISSLRVAPGFRVVVCESSSGPGRTNAGNLGLCRYYGPGQHTGVGDDLNDRISLVAVLAGPSTPRAAVAYRGSKFTGTSQSLGVGGYETVAGELGEVATISSLQVSPGHRSVVCDHDRSSGINTGALGLCRFFAAGKHATVGSDLERKISLVAIGGPALTAFRDSRYTGPSQRFGPGMYEAKRNQLGAVGNDAITSLRVARGYRVVACRHDSKGHNNGGNLGLCRYYGPGAHDLVGTDPNDDISTLVVLAGPSGDPKLTGYRDRDHSGVKKDFGVGIYEGVRKELTPVGNDEISSLRIATGYRAVVCSEDSYRRVNKGSLGLCRYYGAGGHEYVGNDLNDKISLISVAR